MSHLVPQGVLEAATEIVDASWITSPSPQIGGADCDRNLRLRPTIATGGGGWGVRGATAPNLVKSFFEFEYRGAKKVLAEFGVVALLMNIII